MYFSQPSAIATLPEYKQLASYNVKGHWHERGTILQITLPKRHVTRGTPSVASGELAVPKVSCIVIYTYI